MAETTAHERSAQVNEFRKGRKTAKQLMGMSIFSLADGATQGQVHDVVYNPRQGRLVGFTVVKDAGFFSRGEARFLPVDDIHALGDDAITIEDAARLQNFAGKDVNDLAREAGEPVLGKRLLTEDGSFLGAIDDVLIDQTSRNVVAYEVSGGIFADMMRGQTDIPVDNIISIGSEVVIVPASVKAMVEEAKGGLTAVASAAGEKAGEFKDTASEKLAAARTETSEYVDDKEADYARGKTAGETVLDDAGNILVPIGAMITDADIANARAAGRLHALAASAGKMQGSDFVETVKEKYAAGVDAVKTKTGEMVDSAKDKQGDALVGRITGKAVLLDDGATLVPANHVVTQADADAAQVAGKLGALTAAIISETVSDAKEHVGAAYQNAAARVDTAVVTPAPTVAALPVTAAPVTVVIEHPENVTVQTPGAAEVGVPVVKTDNAI